MPTFCLREAGRAKWTRLFASACLDENICIEMSKVSPLLLQVYTTYRCLHLTPIKGKKHPHEVYCVFGLGLSKNVHKTHVGPWVRQGHLTSYFSRIPVRKIITASEIRVQSWENVCLHVISNPNLRNIRKIIPFAFGGTNKICRI